MSIHIYRSGLCHCSVCVPKDMVRDEIVSEVNSQHPTGLDHGWSISDEPTFKAGEPNPCRCDQDASRLHYLMVC